jgi:hypothetical protein
LTAMPIVPWVSHHFTVPVGTLGSIAEMEAATYAAIAAQTQQLWPRTADGGFVTELRLNQALGVVTQAAKAVLPRFVGKEGAELMRQIFQMANKGGDGKPKFLRIAARTTDNKTLFNLILTV